MNNVIVIVYVNVAMSVIISADAVVMNVDNAFDIVDYVAFGAGNRFCITKRIARNGVDNRRFDNRSNRLDRRSSDGRIDAPWGCEGYCRRPQ